MGLDRSSIEKRDFPVKRRGYDPDAVAAHLATLADEMEALRRSPRPESLGTAASDQVRLIVEAAERSAAELRHGGELERGRILAEARGEAQEHLERVARSTASMLERADVLEKEFTSLLKLVRSSATRLTHELRALEGAVDRLRVAPETQAQPVPAPPDDEGARLTALNMALDGTAREETGRYLADHFVGVDVDGLLDDVYVRVAQ